MELAHGADELLGRERLPQHGCADLEDGAVEEDEVWAVVGDEDAHSRLVTQTDPRLSSPQCVGGGCLCRSGWRLSGCARMPGGTSSRRSGSPSEPACSR